MQPKEKRSLERLRDALNAAIIIVFSGILLTFLTSMLFNTSYGIETEDSFFDGELTFHNGPTSPEKLFAVREAVNEMIRKHC